MSKTTIVTSLYDLNRGDLDNNFKRSFDDYVNNFKKLLLGDYNLYIYLDQKLADELSLILTSPNIYLKIMELDELKEWFGFYNDVNEIRKKNDWRSQADWLKDSPQANLDMYNPLVMSKMFMLNDASIYNPHQSEYFYWIDAGISNTVHPGYFYHDKVFGNLESYIKSIDNKFTFISYPYENDVEIHGFERKGMNIFCQSDDINYVCRGGFFGGRKKEINELNSLYWSLLSDTLDKGYMGTEESIFTIMSYLSPHNIHRFEISGDGLVWPFFEYIKDKEWEDVKVEHPYLYILTYNSPNQLQTLLNSCIDYDPQLMDMNLVLINNSTDRSLDDKYNDICVAYGIEEIKYDNIGICGGRQAVAEHFNNTGSDFYLFFEDDMNFYIEKPPKPCKLGFNRSTPNILNRILEIMIKEKYDFIKLSFTEFFGDNSVQWAWYNIPQEVRDKYFPNQNKLPEHGLSPNPPLVEFDNINFIHDLGYVSGDVYYDNWPAMFSREGNRKVFLETKWAHPFEQTWMSYVFQKQQEGEINSAVLLLSPIEHDRFEHYPADERREN